MTSEPACLSKTQFVAGRPLAWICTQKLDYAALQLVSDDSLRMRLGLQALLHCLLETGFNYSSEHHEGASWYTESRGVDPRISTVEHWEAASAKAPLFVLDVPWLRTAKTLREVVDRIFRNGHAHPLKVETSGDIARILFNRPG